jgi:hypothetical protein
MKQAGFALKACAPDSARSWNICLLTISSSFEWGLAGSPA